MSLFVAGVSYKTAPVEVRERLAVHPSVLRCHGCRLKLAGNLSEVVLLSTCNRVEIYGVSPRVNGPIHRLFQQLTPHAGELDSCLYVKEGEEALRHLFSVASGLDSMVLGETEITGQVKQAYLAAHEAGLTGKVTNRCFQAAFQVAKEIRTTTHVGRGATSVGSAAVELAEKVFDGDLARKTVLIIGAGKMGEACIRHLTKKGAHSVLVGNRSIERAQRLAAEFGGRALRFEECLPTMAEADIVVSSTGAAELILRRDDLAKVLPARRHRPLILIDIAVPRDIDPEVQNLEGVYLFNIDHLEALVRENVRQRQLELNHCQNIITARMHEVMERLAARPARRAEPTGVNLFQPAWVAT